MAARAKIKKGKYTNVEQGKEHNQGATFFQQLLDWIYWNFSVTWQVKVGLCVISSLGQA